MRTANVRYFVVDAFTDRPYAGNPAAVCLLSTWREDAWLACVAREMNLSETAFLVENGDGFDLRWFTPAVEVDLCGHATLASAKVLWHARQAPEDAAIRFATRSGILTATLREPAIELDFPLAQETHAEPPSGLLAALGVEALYVGRNRFDYLVQVASAVEVRAARPDFARLAQVESRGVILTSGSDDPRYDFISRFFAPAAGIAEDPVTGSAHCCLAGFWRERLGKSKLLGWQASERGGAVQVEIVGDRVLLGGQATIVACGEWLA